jgi:hypothetical protein
MKSKTLIIVGVATAALLITVALRGRRRRSLAEIRIDDLRYQEHSPDELASLHLVDLNSASSDDLVRLGLESQNVQRIVDNRPYRNKLELLSRMVISEPAYELIKEHIGIAGATEPVKAAL